MIVSDIKTRVKRAFGDESGVQVTDDDMVRWINDGQRQIAMQNENLLEAVALTSTNASQQNYTQPLNLLILRSVGFKYSGETSYFKIYPLNFAAFNEYVDGWDGASTGRPVTYTVYKEEILLWPAPDLALTDAIKIYYNRKPTDVVNDADTPDLPILYHEALVKYCLQQAYEMDEDFEAATAKSAELASDVLILREREGNKQHETYPVITVRAEDW